MLNMKQNEGIIIPEYTLHEILDRLSTEDLMEFEDITSPYSETVVLSKSEVYLKKSKVNKIQFNKNLFKESINADMAEVA